MRVRGLMCVYVRVECVYVCVCASVCVCVCVCVCPHMDVITSQIQMNPTCPSLEDLEIAEENYSKAKNELDTVLAELGDI